MPRIIPIRDLKDTAAISQMCSESTEPVYITKNGYGDMVIMSMKAYEEKMYLLEVYAKLAEAEEEVRAGKTADARQALRQVHAFGPGLKHAARNVDGRQVDRVALHEAVALDGGQHGVNPAQRTASLVLDGSDFVHHLNGEPATRSRPMAARTGHGGRNKQYYQLFHRCKGKKRWESEKNSGRIFAKCKLQKSFTVFKFSIL